MKQPVIIHIANEADWMPVMKKIEQIWPEAKWLNKLKSKPTEFNPSASNSFTKYPYIIHIEWNRIYWEKAKTKKAIPAAQFLADGQGEEPQKANVMQRILEERELRQAFRNNTNCYADTWSQDGIGAPMVEGDVIPAMTEDKFIEVVTAILNTPTKP